jgi:acetoin utilization protein AcuC
MILAEPLTYDNAVRYEKYGFDYLNGRRLMLEIDRQFQAGGALFRKLDGSTPFRRPEMATSVHGRSWAIHDGILLEAGREAQEGSILAQPWEEVRIYKNIGQHAGVRTFRDPPDPTQAPDNTKL